MSLLDDRWDSAQPECGEDFCANCAECLACSGSEVCTKAPVESAPFHEWLNSAGEVALV